ncbi:hypothetical protein NE236_38800 [Actinoallomurus purpureus]|uniref:hypothetical protein n=1 Tax=Actinoallomurus purpureus TaxID=478114 RepID=UPI0020929DDA|nr:hypothetical protein [Actinoallomurus purpureus]MCO6010924.1 hypothetical protein [Actinoallomurus purpureus]
MARWRSKSGNVAEDSGQNGSPAERTAPQPGRHRPDGEPVRKSLARAAGAVATLVAVAATVIAIVLALHIAFVVFSANQANPIVRTVNDWAQSLAWEFRDMFTPKDQRVAVIVDYGIAAVVYLIAGRVGAGLIRRIR